jgi:hypothetical protein
MKWTLLPALLSALLAIHPAMPAYASDAPTTETTVEVPKPPLRTGEAFFLNIRVLHSPGQLGLLPEEIHLHPDVMERIANRAHARRSEGTQEVDTYRLELLAFRPGKLSLASIPIAVGSTVTQSQPVSITVESALDDAAKQAASTTSAEALDALTKMVLPPPTPVAIPELNRLLVGSLAAGLVGLLLVGLGVRWYRGRSKTSVLAEPPASKAIPPDVQALEALDELRKRYGRRDVTAKELYTELSLILRGYLAARYRFDALECTLDELVQFLSGQRTRELNLSQLQAVLGSADQVKYAKFKPTEPDIHTSLNAAYDILEKTRGSSENADGQKVLQ